MRLDVLDASKIYIYLVFFFAFFIFYLFFDVFVDARLLYGCMFLACKVILGFCAN